MSMYRHALGPDPWPLARNDLVPGLTPSTDLSGVSRSAADRAALGQAVAAARQLNRGGSRLRQLPWRRGRVTVTGTA